MLKGSLLILMAGKNARGGINNYFFSLRSYFPENIIYLKRGSRNWPDRKNRIIETLRLLHDFFVYSYHVLFSTVKLVQVNTAFSLKSVQRDSIYIILAKFLRKKIIIFFRGWDENSIGIFEGKSFYKKIFFKADAIIDLRRSNIEQLKRWGFANKIYLETTVVDSLLMPYIKDLDLDKKYSSKGSRPISILFLARIELRKGIYEAIKAFELLRVKHPETRLLIAGDGSETDNAKQYCKSRRIDNISFQGFVSGIEKAHSFMNADIYLFPSYSEGMPSSVLEAMAFGIPVVTTNVGGLPDFFVNGKHGFMVEKNEPGVLSESLSRIIDNKSLMHSMAINNYQLAQELFVPEKVSKRMMAIFEETLNSVNS